MSVHSPQAAHTQPGSAKTVADILTGRCRSCDGEGWVCENHTDRPWGGMSPHRHACHCGAGSPCWTCNLEMALAGPLSEERGRSKALLEALEGLVRVYPWFPGHINGGYPDGHPLPVARAAAEKARTAAEDDAVGMEPVSSTGGMNQKNGAA